MKRKPHASLTKRQLLLLRQGCIILSNMFRNEDMTDLLPSFQDQAEYVAQEYEQIAYALGRPRPVVPKGHVFPREVM